MIAVWVPVLRVIELLEEAMNNISSIEELGHTSMVTVDDTSSAASSTILLSPVDISSGGDHNSDRQSCSTTDVAQGNVCLIENSSIDVLSTDQTFESVTEGHNNVICLEAAKSTLKVQEFKIDCITAVKQGKDVIVVQPTGSGKSVCFILPALVFPGKVSLVIEPVVAVIINQVEALQKKGIKALALGKATGSKNPLIIIQYFIQHMMSPW